MKGYPKHIAIKQDFINLLTIEEFKERVLVDLLAICNLDDDKATKAITLIDSDDPDQGWNMEIIDNPFPTWKQKGFESRQEIENLIIENGGEI